MKISKTKTGWRVGNHDVIDLGHNCIRIHLCNASGECVHVTGGERLFDDESDIVWLVEHALAEFEREDRARKARK